MPDLKDIGGKITAAKVKKLTLQNALHLNAQLHKEVSSVERDLANAEDSAKIVREKELDVRRISEATDTGYRQTLALTDIIAESISSIETRLSRLSLTKEWSAGTIKQRAHEKLSAFPKSTQIQKQQELLSTFLEHLTTTSIQDGETCCKTQEEIKMLQEAINEKTTDNALLVDNMIALKEEIASITVEIGNSAKIEAQFEESVASSSAISDELQSHLVDILASIPSDDSVGASINDLKIQEDKIIDVENEIASLNIQYNQTVSDFEKFKTDSRTEFALLQQSAEKEEENINAEIIDLEDEISQTDVMIKGIRQRRDIVMQKLLRAHPGKTLAQVEEQLDAAENAEITELERLTAELEDENNRKTEQEKETESELEQLALHLQSEKDTITATESDLKSKEEAICKKYDEVGNNLKLKKEALEKINLEIEELSKKKALIINNRKACPVTPRRMESVSEIIYVKMEPVDILPPRKVPIVEGIESLSPETKRQKEERIKNHSRAIEHSLVYTDLSMDSDGNTTLRSPPPKEKKKPSELKRLRVENAKRIETRRQASLKKPATQPKVAKPIRMPSSICSEASTDESADLDLETDNATTAVNPPAAYLDDSLFDDDSDAGNVSMDSLFTNSPPKNGRCIPDNVFLDNSGYSVLTNRKTPPATVSEDNNGLDDSLEDDGSIDQSIWD